MKLPLNSPNAAPAVARMTSQRRAELEQARWDKLDQARWEKFDKAWWIIQDEPKNHQSSDNAGCALGFLILGSVLVYVLAFLAIWN